MSLGWLLNLGFAGSGAAAPAAATPSFAFVRRTTSPLGVHVVLITWQVGDSGELSEYFDLRRLGPLEGTIDRIVTVPSTVTAPTDNYDIAIYDRNSFDVLLAAGANRDTANVETAWVYDGLTTAHHADLATAGPLRLSVTNAGVGAGGLLAIYIVP